MRSAEVSASLIDRIAISAFSGLLAFATGSVIWFMLAYFIGYEMASLDSYQKIVGGFTFVMAVLGFITATNIISSVFGWLWKVLHGVAKWWF